jgi:hypothetical protein
MGRIAVFFAGLIASTGLAVAAAPAAGAATVRELAGGPLVLTRLGPFHSYRVVVEAAALPTRTVVAVELVRVQGAASQTTDFSFSLRRAALRIGRDAASASLDTGSAMGRFGRIRLTFTCSRRAPGGARSRCLGSRRARSGRLTGMVDVRTKLGRIFASSLPARLVAMNLPLPGSTAGGGIGAGQPSIGRPNCRQYPHAAVLAVVPTAKPTARFALGTLLAARQGSGPIVLMAAVTRQRPPATEVGAIQAAVPRSALALDGTRTARFDASGVPFLSGRVTFSRTGSLPGCATRAAVGTVAGSLRARLDFFGTVSLLTATRTAGAILIGPA